MQEVTVILHPKWTNPERVIGPGGLDQFGLGPGGPDQLEQMPINRVRNAVEAAVELQPSANSSRDDKTSWAPMGAGLSFSSRSQTTRRDEEKMRGMKLARQISAAGAIGVLDSSKSPEFPLSTVDGPAK